MIKNNNIFTFYFIFFIFLIILFYPSGNNFIKNDKNDKIYKKKYKNIFFNLKLLTDYTLL